jgi:hypothetical protein
MRIPAPETLYFVPPILEVLKEEQVLKEDVERLSGSSQGEVLRAFLHAGCLPLIGANQRRQDRACRCASAGRVPRGHRSCLRLQEEENK